MFKQMMIGVFGLGMQRMLSRVSPHTSSAEVGETSSAQPARDAGRVSKTATVAVFKTDKTGPVYRCFRAVYRKSWFSRVGFIEKPVGYPYRAASVRPVTAVTGPVTNGKVNPGCRCPTATARPTNPATSTKHWESTGPATSTKQWRSTSSTTEPVSGNAQ
jgi:hypothetical protein